MTSLLIDRIGMLVTNDTSAGLGALGVLTDVAVCCEDGRVVSVGAARHAPAADVRLDAEGGCVIPGFVDSHTHLVFAGDRVDEFAARASGRPYEAGGIRVTVAATRAASDEELTANVGRLAAEALRSGSTLLEIKSGYALSTEEEARHLAVAGSITDEVTFLGAHVLPEEFAADRAGYVELVAGEMLNACAPLSRWCDVFVEEGAFDEDESRRILVAGNAAGLGLRVHANQLGHGPGARLAAELGAASADHVTFLTKKDVSALAEAGVVATLVPAAEFSTRTAYADGRALLDAGVTVALASDCNPGTSYTTSIPFVIALAVRYCGLAPDEALLAATLGGAAALRRDDVGRIALGSRADLVLLDAPSHAHLSYRPGVDLIRSVVRGGSVVFDRHRDG